MGSVASNIQFLCDNVCSSGNEEVDLEEIDAFLLLDHGENNNSSNHYGDREEKNPPTIVHQPSEPTPPPEGIAMFLPGDTTDVEVVDPPEPEALDFTFKDGKIRIMVISASIQDEAGPRKKPLDVSTFVSVQVTGSTSQLQTTSTQKHTSQPQWNEEFIFNVQNPTDDVLSFRLMEPGTVRDKNVASLRIPVSDVIRIHSGKIMVRFCQLSNLPCVDDGTFRIKNM